MNMRYLVLMSILSGTTLMMVGCGQKGALFLPEELPEELSEKLPSEEAKQAPQSLPDKPPKVDAQ